MNRARMHCSNHEKHSFKLAPQKPLKTLNPTTKLHQNLSKSLETVQNPKTSLRNPYLVLGTLYPDFAIPWNNLKSLKAPYTCSFFCKIYHLQLAFFFNNSVSGCNPRLLLEILDFWFRSDLSWVSYGFCSILFTWVGHCLVYVGYLLLSGGICCWFY